MIGRIHMGAVVRGQGELFDGPAFTTGEIIGFEAGEEIDQLVGCLLVVEIFDAGTDRRRVGHNPHFERDGQIDVVTRHWIDLTDNKLLLFMNRSIVSGQQTKATV